MSPLEAANSDKQRKSCPSISSTSVSIDSTHPSTSQQLRTCIDDSLAKHLYGESQILQCIASSGGYASSTSSSSSASEAFAARVGLYAIAHPGSASPRELVVRVMDWAEDVEQHAPMLERKRVLLENTPLLPHPSRYHSTKYGTVGERKTPWVCCRNNVATYWDSVGDRKIHLYFREDEIVGENELESDSRLGLTWWQYSMFVILVFATIAVGSWVMLFGRARENA